MTPPDSIRVHLSFGRSSSCYYPYAVGLAEDLPGYEQSGEGRRLRHSVDAVLPLLESELWDRVLALYRIIVGWNSGEVRLENTPFDSLSDLGQSLANVRGCYARREDTGLGDAFCSGKVAPDADAEAFGCHHIGGVTRALPNRGQAGYQVRRGEFSWWQFGTLTDDNTRFVVNKVAILEMLRHRATRQICTFCPAFSWERVQRDLDDLPSEILLDDDSKFEVRYSEINPSKALGIGPRRYSARPRIVSLDMSDAFDHALDPVPADDVWVAPLARAFHTSHCGVCGDPRWHVTREAALERGLTPCPICEP